MGETGRTFYFVILDKLIGLDAQTVPVWSVVMDSVDHWQEPRNHIPIDAVDNDSFI